MVPDATIYKLLKELESNGSVGDVEIDVVTIKLSMNGQDLIVSDYRDGRFSVEFDTRWNGHEKPIELIQLIERNTGFRSID